MRYVFLDPDDTWPSWLAVVVIAPTGVAYQQQCAGVACDQREVDWGGCRCQALAVVGDAAATDPACALSPRHADLRALADEAAAQPAPDFVYRRMTPHNSKAALAATTS